MFRQLAILIKIKYFKICEGMESWDANHDVAHY